MNLSHGLVLSRRTFLATPVAALWAQGEAAAPAPAPLFRDPIYDGAADPVAIWNRQEKNWWLLYTQGRANVDGPARTIHVTYTFFVPEGKSIKQVRFNEDWVNAGD